MVSPRDDVVMHLPVLIIGQGILLQTVLHHLVSNNHLSLRCSFHYEFQDVQQLPGVTTTIAQHGTCLLQFYLPFFQDAILMDGPVEQLQQIVFLQRLQHIELTAREQRTDHLKRRIFRGGADQCHDALLHCPQQGILL